MSRSANLEERLLLLWGKTNKDNPERYHPLLYHLLDAAAVSMHLISRFGMIDGVAPLWAAYVIALHDIGKADPLFQNKSEIQAESLHASGFILPVETEVFRHEARSADWVRAHLVGFHNWGRRSADVVSLAVHGHHGNFGSSGNVEEIDFPHRFEAWENIRSALARSVADILHLGELTPAPGEFQNASIVGVQLSGLIVLSDWIASNEDLYDYWPLSMLTDPLEYWHRACDEAARAVCRLALDLPEGAPERSEPLCFSEVWPDCTVLRPSQSALEAECLKGIPLGLAIIEAPMGEGKTEAAIYLAEHWTQGSTYSGAYIALPTMATSNQMYGRYGRFLGRYHPNLPSPYLVHGMAWLMDDSSPMAGSQIDAEDNTEESLSREWFQNSKRALLAGHGVGTVDQALMSVLHVKHGSLRLLGLSSKVLIIDEVHAYDEYMTVLMERLLGWCSALRIPVILLSATLSRRQRARLCAAYRADAALPSHPDSLDPYPLLTFVPLEGEPYTASVDAGGQGKRRVEVRCHPGLLEDAERTAETAVEASRNGGCVCVLANTVKSAQSIFDRLSNLHPKDTQLYLFHARFTADRRSQIEDTVVSLFGKEARRDGSRPRPDRAILVATQVVEQSLDLDFDVMISELAPIDLLLQRSGRLHRHERGSRPTGSVPTLHILMPDEDTLDLGATGNVYGDELLLRTIDILHGRTEIVLPDDFRPLIESCYGDLSMPPAAVPKDRLNSAAQTRRRKLEGHRQEAGTHLIPDPNPRVFQLAEMARPVDEGEEGDRASYFHAQTRLGDDTRSVLVLSDLDLIAACRADRMPRRETMRNLFMRKASIPGWWLRGLTAGEGYEEPFDGPRWLRGHIVIPMRDGVWRGSANGTPVELKDDRTLGLQRV